MNIFVIDIGTSSMRGILFDSRGKRLGEKQVKYQPDKYPDGRIEQDPGNWTNSLETIASAVAEEAKQKGISIDAVAVTAQRSAILPVDKQGKPLMNTIMWQDRRNKEICAELEPYNELVFQKSGAKINTVFSGSRMAWILRNRPDLQGKIHKLVNIPEYVMHHMTGEYRTDATYGSRSHLMNLRERRWDQELLKLFGVEEEFLCEIQEPGSCCGRVQASFSRGTGLPQGIPVISAGGDQQCAAVGQGAFCQGNLSLVAGTGGFLVAALDEVPENLSPDLICNCSSVSGKYIVEANVLTCCSAFDWYCRNFYDWDQPDYEKLNEELRDWDGKISSAMVLPYFQGRSTPQWNPEAKAYLGEITLATGRTELLKGLLEGIAMEIQNNIRLFGSYAKISQAYISGGLTKSPAINQLQADVYGMPLYRMSDSESTALGALMVALVGLGEYPSLEEAFGAVRAGEKVDCFRPRMELHEQYANKRAAMNRIYRQLYT